MSLCVCRARHCDFGTFLKFSSAKYLRKYLLVLLEGSHLWRARWRGPVFGFPASAHVIMVKQIVWMDGSLSSEQLSKGHYADHLMPSSEDLEFEEEVMRSGTLPRVWLAYLDAKKDAHAKRRYLIYERAVKMLPGSYKVCPSPARSQVFFIRCFH